LFYIRLSSTEEDLVVRKLKDGLYYLLGNEKNLGKSIVGTIFVE
jgi:hypothetical protein